MVRVKACTLQKIKRVFQLCAWNLMNGLPHKICQLMCILTRGRHSHCSLKHHKKQMYKGMSFTHKLMKKVYDCLVTNKIHHLNGSIIC